MGAASLSRLALLRRWSNDEVEPIVLQVVRRLFAQVIDGRLLAKSPSKIVRPRWSFIANDDVVFAVLLKELFEAHVTAAEIVFLKPVERRPSSSFLLQMDEDRTDSLGWINSIDSPREQLLHCCIDLSLGHDQTE